MITTILRKHNGGFRNYWYPDVKEPNLYVNEDIKKQYSIGCYDAEKQLLEKWKKYIPKGWYGFAIGEPCPLIWYKIIDDFLTYLEKLQTDKKISDFEIHQIKMKFGGIRFYVGYSCEDSELSEFLRLQIDKLENDLFDEKLIF